MADPDQQPLRDTTFVPSDQTVVFLFYTLLLGLSKVRLQLLGERAARGCIDELFFVMILIQPVVLVPRKNMDVQVPYVLISSGFVMLARRRAVAPVRTADCQRNLFHTFVYFCQNFLGNIVDVFVVLVWHYKDMTGVINPPFWGYFCSDKFVLVDDIFLCRVFVFVAIQKSTKGARVVRRLVVKLVRHSVSIANKKTSLEIFFRCNLGRGSRTRTYDTWFWRPVLYQLSYAPLRYVDYYTTGLPLSEKLKYNAPRRPDSVC